MLEHLSEEQGLQAIKVLCAAGRRILFTSTPTDFEEVTHVNVKPPIYWLHHFAENGMSPMVNFDAQFITPHAIMLEHARPDRSMGTT